MEALKHFEWMRDPQGFRLAWIPIGRTKAQWVEPGKKWSEKYDANGAENLHIRTTEYRRESCRAHPGLYIAGYRHDVNVRKSSPHAKPQGEIVRPFETDELVSLNLLRLENSPRGWLQFANRYGLLGHPPPLERWHLTGRDQRLFTYEVEHEAEWHRLRKVLRSIFVYYPAIKKRDSKRVTSAAFALRDGVNRYLRNALSIEIDFDMPDLNFNSSIRYSSFGAALIAEAVEFIAGRFEAKQCVVCGSWFRSGAAQRRRDRVFCSAACKMRDYRHRKHRLESV